MGQKTIGAVSREILRTERLRLRELTEADLPALAKIMQDPVAMAAYEKT